MKFIGTIYNGAQEGYKSKVPLGIIKDEADQWVIQFLYSNKPTRGAVIAHVGVIAYIIVSGRILRFQPKLFKKGIVIYNYEHPKTSLVTVDQIIES